MGKHVVRLENRLGEFGGSAMEANDGLSWPDSDLKQLDSLWPVINGLNLSRGRKSFVYGIMWDLYHAEENKKTFHHSVNLASMVSDAAFELGLDRNEIVLAALVHDIGKVYISNEVLSKPGRYNAEDVKEMHKHPGYSHEVLKNHLPRTAEIVLRHHNYQEEMSYPEDLPDISGTGSGREILKYAEVLAKFDYKEASTSPDRAKDGWGDRDDVRASVGNLPFAPVRYVKTSSDARVSA